MTDQAYVALLRGINLGRHRQLAMADLQQVLRSLGFEAVTTYLRSGNALFTSPEKDPEGLSRRIEQAITDSTGMDVPVLVRTAAELRSVVVNNPFPQAASQPKQVHVAFLSAQPDPELVSAVDPTGFAPDEMRLGDRVLYLWYPNGLAGSALAGEPERGLGVTATSRNWNTVVRLADMAAALGTAPPR